MNWRRFFRSGVRGPYAPFCERKERWADHPAFNLLDLAGLQSISSSIYEAADVEGATAWESFWLITFPMLSPLILTAIVYTIIDSFTSAGNELVSMIRSIAFTSQGFGVSTAMAVLYFTVIAAVLGLVLKVVSKWVFYQE